MKFIDYAGLRHRGIPGAKISIWRKERARRFPKRIHFGPRCYAWPESVIDAYMTALAAGSDEENATIIAERARPPQSAVA
jgi:hypothetical protein